MLIDPRYRPRHLAVKAVGDLANALHIPGESLSAQRAGDGKQIFLWPGSFKHGLERIPERLGIRLVKHHASFDERFLQRAFLLDDVVTQIHRGTIQMFLNNVLDGRGDRAPAAGIHQ